MRTVRIECLDWLLIWNDRHLHRVLATYVAHYNEARPHRGLGLDIPVPAAAIGEVGARDAVGPIERFDVLGGLVMSPAERPDPCPTDCRRSSSS